MSIIAKSNGEGMPRLEDGVYTAQCVGLVDMGEQFSEIYQKATPKIRLIWAIVGETFTDAEGNEQMRTMGKEYSLSLSNKAALRKDLEAWRGKPFSEEELKGFNMANLLNKPCQLQLITKSKNDKSYSDIASIMGLPKGMQVEPLKATYIFDFDDATTFCNYLIQPEFIQKRIKQATNYAGSELEAWVKENQLDLEAPIESQGSAETDPNDLPF